MTSQTKGRSFGHIVPLGRLAGIRIGAHWSLALVLVLLAALLANNQFPATAKGHATSTYWLLGIGTSVVFMASLVAHELAHAVVARRYGIRVEGMTLWMLGGLTKLDGEPKSAKEDFWIAASGPITTLVLAAGYGELAAAVGFSTALGAAFSWLCAMSVVLGVFNLIPATPLDGGRILRALVWRVTGDRARAVSAAGAAGGIFGALLIGYGLFSVLAGNALGLWLAIIGWFIMGSSRAERWVDRSSALAGLTAGDAMVPAPLVCPSWAFVEGFLTEVTTSAITQPAYPVIDIDGLAVGAVTIADLQHVPAAKRADTRISETTAGRRAGTPIVPTTMPLAEVAMVMRLRGRGVVIVVVDDLGRAVGVLDERQMAAVASKPHAGRERRNARYSSSTPQTTNGNGTTSKT
jgi:Zn-dependent protease